MSQPCPAGSVVGRPEATDCSPEWEAALARIVISSPIFREKSACLDQSHQMSAAGHLGGPPTSPSTVSRWPTSSIEAGPANVSPWGYRVVVPDMCCERSVSGGQRECPISAAMPPLDP